MPSKLEEARRVVEYWMVQSPNLFGKAPKSFMTDVDALIRAAKDEEAEEAMERVKALYRNNPTGWCSADHPCAHNKQVGCVCARIAARGKEGEE